MKSRRSTTSSYASRKLDASRASLLFGTALGVSIAIFAASPQQAWAADECGADVGGIAVCTNAGDPYATGIDYVGDAAEDITVVLLGGGLAPTIVTATDDGVTATASVGQNATVYTYGAASIDAALNGIEVDAGTGNAYVDANGSITAGLAGINAYSFFGNTYVTNTGDITVTGAAAGRAQGIYAYSDGYTNVTNSGSLTVTEASGSLAIGVFAETFAGDTVVDNSGVVDVSNTVGGAYGLVGFSDFGGDVFITGNSTITANGQSNAGGIYVGAYDNGTVNQTGDIDVTGVTGTGRGVQVTAYYDASVTVTGDIGVTGGTSAYGVEVDTSQGYAGSDATVNVTGDITAVAGSSFGEGVDVYAGGDISVTVNGSISATGAGAYGVFAYSYYGDVTVDVDNITADATLGGGAGIDAFAAGSFGTLANIDITSGNIDTTGDGVEGIDAVALYGDIDINAGNITTTGIGSEGIYTVSYYNTTILAGDITTTGDGAQGVDALAILGNADITTGDVSTSGLSADGIYGYSLLGNVSINSGDVTTLGDDSYGIYAYAFLGNSVVTAEDINTSGAGSTGIFAYGFGYVSVAAVSVTTSGDNAEGVTALAETGAAVVETQLVVTSGNSSTGIDAISADSYVLVTSGTVNTTGDDSDGIYAISLGTDPTDYVTVNSTTITTDGLNSDGIVAYAYAGPLTIDSGTIDTLGGNSYGIYAQAYLGDVSVTSDAITTAGVNSTGIFALSTYGGVTVDSGSVDTDGDNSAGIDVLAYGAVDVTSVSVQTDGDGSIGISALSGLGTVTIDSGTVDTLGDVSTGIFAYGYGGTSVTSDSVTTDGLGSEGIVALDIIGPTTVISGAVTTNGDYSNGIRAGSFYDVSVDSGTVETFGDSSIGIYAYSVGGAVLGDGSVDVTFDSVVTHGDAYYQGSVYLPAYQVTLYYYATSSTGILATAATGEVSVVGGDVTTYGTGAVGIDASGFGSVYVNVDDVVTRGDALLNYAYVAGATDYYRGAVGISAVVTGGDVTVIADSVTTYGYEAAGIVAVGNAYYDSVATTFSGDTVVDVNTVTTFGDFAPGIVASNSGGNTTVTSYSVYTGGDYSDGIVATATGYYDSAGLQVIYGDVEVNSTFVTTRGYNSYGINATAAAGDVEVNSYSVFTYGDFSTGIYAAAFNYYDSTTGAEANIQGDVEVNSTRVYTFGDFSAGIVAYAEGGNISITSNQVVTNGDFSDGIDAFAAYYLDPVLLTYYSGDVYVSATSTTTFGDSSDGVSAYAAGGDVLIRASLVRAYGLGSDAIYAGTGGFDASNSDDVAVYTYATIYSYDAVGIHVNSAGYSDIYVESGSVYGYLWGIQSTSANGTYIYNDGVISGGFGAAIDVDGGAAEIVNYGTIYGYVDLTDNNDYLYNGGLWEAYGTSSFGLGADEVVNDGTVGFSRYQGAASTTTFAGLEAFNNYGTVTGVDGQAGDSLNISGNFFGGAGSELELDVQLGGPGSIADTLVIGSASGVTEILPNDVLAGSPGALNFGGILVVNSANAAETGAEFTMANVDKGFIEYSLIFDAANDNWLIVGLPDSEVFELLGAMSSSQDFWKRSGDAVTARWQEIRDAGGAAGMSAGPGGAGRSDGWELWMQAHGGDESFDNLETFAINGFTFATDLTADTDWRGFQFGFDNLQGNTLWGLTMGFNQQETQFNFDGNSFDTEGWNIGGYFGWKSNGFFMNALVKGDFFEQDANFHTLPSIFTFDGVTWGAQGEIGYRWEGDSWFFEPIAALSWNTTSLDSVTTAGATIDFDDSESFRGKAGARIGGTWGSGDVVWTPYVGAYYVDEFEGDNSLTFTTGPTSITFNDQGRGSYGLADFGVTFQTFYGLEGFVKGEWNFGGDADGGAARLGARWRW